MAQGFRDLTDKQCLDLVKQIESQCARLFWGNRFEFDSAGHALIRVLKDQTTYLRIFLEIIDKEKRRNTNDSREN